MSVFTEDQIKKIEELFTVLGNDIAQQAHYDYCRNDAAKEAVNNVASAVTQLDVRYILGNHL